MSFHPWGLVVFSVLTLALVLLFAAGLCQVEPGGDESDLEGKNPWN